MLDKCILCDCRLQSDPIYFNSNYCYQHPVDYNNYYDFAFGVWVVGFIDKSGKYLCRWFVNDLSKCRLENGLFVNLNLLDFKTDFNSNLEKLKTFILFQ
jgi:hypothetical protein